MSFPFLSLETLLNVASNRLSHSREVTSTYQICFKWASNWNLRRNYIQYNNIKIQV
ncbi:hypothetical protein LINPERPRIM_LOCUS8830 [Linum perenne]